MIGSIVSLKKLFPFCNACDMMWQAANHDIHT
jgi:hypothetical protein